MELTKVLAGAGNRRPNAPLPAPAGTPAGTPAGKEVLKDIQLHEKLGLLNQQARARDAAGPAADADGGGDSPTLNV